MSWDGCTNPVVCDAWPRNAQACRYSEYFANPKNVANGEDRSRYSYDILTERRVTPQNAGENIIKKMLDRIGSFNPVDDARFSRCTQPTAFSPPSLERRNLDPPLPIPDPFAGKPVSCVSYLNGSLEHTILSTYDQRTSIAQRRFGPFVRYRYQGKELASPAVPRWSPMRSAQKARANTASIDKIAAKIVQRRMKV